MATFYEFFNEQKYADAVKNVSVVPSKAQLPTLSPWPLPGPTCPKTLLWLPSEPSVKVHLFSVPKAFYYVTFYCYNTLTTTNLGREGFICHTLLHHSPSLREVRTGTRART